MSIREVACRVVSCDKCGATLEGDGFTMHFSSEEACNPSDYDWHVNSKGYVRCTGCIEDLPPEAVDEMGWPKEEAS